MKIKPYLKFISILIFDFNPRANGYSLSIFVTKTYVLHSKIQSDKSSLIELSTTEIKYKYNIVWSNAVAYLFKRNKYN